MDPGVERPGCVESHLGELVELINDLVLPTERQFLAIMG